MKALNMLAAAAGFAVIGTASAGAVEVRQSMEFAATPAQVWAKVGGWCSLKQWHPAVINCDDSKKGMRTLFLKDASKIVEKQIKSSGESYSYEIVDSPLPVKNYTATFSAKPAINGGTTLEWVAKFDAKGKTESEAAAAINGVFESGLKNIKDIVKFDATPAAASVPAASAAVAAKDDARLKAREARARKLEELKLKALDEIAKEKEAFAKLREELLAKAKSAAAAARAEYDKAKAALEKAAAPGKS